jgi:hypothetical protein
MRHDGEARALLTEAQLLVASADDIAIWLQERSKKGGTLAGSGGDARVEQTLLARRNGRVDLALAEFAFDPGVVGELFARTRSAEADPLREKYRQGLRLACLANEVGGLCAARSDNGALLLTPEHLQRICVTGSDAEIETLLSNSGLPAEVLVRLYRNSRPFDSLADERRARLVAWSAVNPRFERNQPQAGGADPWQAATQPALPRLIATAAVTPYWLAALCDLLYRRRPDLAAVPSKIEFDLALTRWQAGAGRIGDELKGHLTDLPLVQEFRCLFAAVYGRIKVPGGTQVLGAAAHADIARRCAYYGKAALKVEDLAALHARDGDVFVLALLMNDAALRNGAVRQTIERDFLGERTRYVYQARLAQIKLDDPRFDVGQSSDGASLNDAVLEMRPAASTPPPAIDGPRLARIERRLDALVYIIAFGFLVLGALLWRIR